MAKEKGFFAEFKKFITRGNVLDMAVGVIIGGAFTDIVKAVSDSILKPIINWVLAMLIGKDGLAGAVIFLSKVYTLGEDGAPVLDELGNQVIDLKNSISIELGVFISAVINFLLIAFVLFVIVRTMNKVAAAKAEAIEGLDLNEKRAIRQIRKEQKVSKLAACAIYLDRLEAAKAAKAEEERIAQEKAAEEARLAEEKAMANTVLLTEIRDLLKNK